MTTTEQENFENSAILESDLGFVCTQDGILHKITIDDLKYKTLDEIQLEKGRIVDSEEKKLLNIYVWFKLKQLTQEEQKLAELYYIQGKTEEEISDIMDFTILSKNDKRKGQKEKISRQAVSLRINNIKDKLKDI
jgi:DNA-directed RNA polymerase specialized sigma subunit